MHNVKFSTIRTLAFPPLFFGIVYGVAHYFFALSAPLPTVLAGIFTLISVYERCPPFRRRISPLEEESPVSPSEAKLLVTCLSLYGLACGVLFALGFAYYDEGTIIHPTARMCLKWLGISEVHAPDAVFFGMLLLVTAFVLKEAGRIVLQTARKTEGQSTV